MLLQAGNEVVPTLGPARGRIHRVKRDPPVVVGGKPIVRENRIRLLRGERVIEDMHFYRGRGQRLDRLVKFRSRLRSERIG